MTTTETTIPLGKLVPSGSNVRRITDKADRAALAASIEHHGLIQNLVVRKAGKGNKYEVVADGRRLDALSLLMKDGRSIEGVAVTKDYPVRAVLKVWQRRRDFAGGERAARRHVRSCLRAVLQ